MVTMISLLKRREDMSLADFHAWYDEHATAATSLPNLQRYSIYKAVDPDGPWDGISALTYDRREDLEESLNSSEGERSRADTRDHISAREAFVVEHRRVL